MGKYNRGGTSVWPTSRGNQQQAVLTAYGSFQPRIYWITESFSEAYLTTTKPFETERAQLRHHSVSWFSSNLVNISPTGFILHLKHLKSRKNNFSGLFWSIMDSFPTHFLHLSAKSQHRNTATPKWMGPAPPTGENSNVQNYCPPLISDCYLFI